MKKICALIVFVLLLTLITSACQAKKADNSMVKAERRFAKYTEPQAQQKNNQYVDLSEGPKLKYDAYLGPTNLNFDFKIVDPY